MIQFKIATILILLLGAPGLLEFAECLPNEISYTWSSTNCPGEDRALGSTDVALSYQYLCSERITYKSIVITKNSYNQEEIGLTYEGADCENITEVEFMFEQQEHGGGGCNCVQICFGVCEGNSEVNLCHGSASLPRRKRIGWTVDDHYEVLNTAAIMNKEIPFQLGCTNPPYIKISFWIHLSCGDPVDNFDEGVEFSVRVLPLSNDWIPVRLVYRGSGSDGLIRIGTRSSLKIRGYRVNNEINIGNNWRQIEVDICCIERINFIQLRWLQTVRFVKKIRRDVWILDDVYLALVSSNSTSEILHDNFQKNNLSSQVWPEDHVRNGELFTCNNKKGLVFGRNSITDTDSWITHSRGLLTNTFNISELHRESQDTNNCYSNTATSVKIIEPTTVSATSEPTTPSPSPTSKSTTSKSTTSEPTTSESTTSESITSDPTTSEPNTSEPSTSESSTSESSTSEFSTSEFSTSEFATSESSTSEHTTSEPTTSESTTSESSESSTSEFTTPSPSTTSKSTTSESTTSESSTSESTTPSPSPTSKSNTSEPTTSEPNTSEPTTSKSTTYESSTAESTTSESTTYESSTAESTTSKSTTYESSTAESTTSESTTPSPSPTSKSTTSEPTTSEPNTSEPTTSESTTSEPTTSESTTSEPSTSEPTTSESTTSESITSESTTMEPTTSEPTTSESTTSESITSESTTSESITSESTTSEPTTSEYTTSEPTTSESTTSKPSTSESTTSEYTTSESTTSEPTTSESITSEFTTSEPTTSESSTSEPTSPSPSPTYESTNFKPTNPTQSTIITSNLLSTTPPTDRDYVVLQQQRIMDIVLSNPVLMNIVASQNSSEKVDLLQNVTADNNTDILVSAYLYTYVINSLASAPYSASILEAVMQIGNDILNSQVQTSSLSALTAASSVLEAIDTVLFTYAPETGTFKRSNITIQSEVIELDSASDPIVAINTSTIDSSPRITLTLPLELLNMFDEDTGVIRIVSAVYRNSSQLLVDNNISIGSDIISASLQCGNGSCPTSNLTLSSSNVSITFKHSKAIKDELERGAMIPTCVFLDLLEDTSSLLNLGRWSGKGCTKNSTLSSTSKTVCDCNHLTHFAILLSPRPLEASAAVIFSLTVIGYVGVAVSVIAMTLTAFTFIWLKSLHSMRNYIHVNLCISLAIAQITFVAGVDKTGSSDDTVPIHCQVIAVFLHYFFLVSFMWMLMEGVVLYVALVRVFVKHKKRYIVAFTVTSYGLPLLYMGVLALPVGFSIRQHNYGYHTVCFLNPENNFILTFIIPFIVIFLANIGFFIMAAKIMWHHQMKQIDKKKVQNLRSWLRSAMFLAVIMCLTWILGVVIIEVDQLLPLAYIYTIMVAFQGLFIFLIFVVFSKAVREAYSKWWRVKVSESEFLSKHFQDSRLSNRMKEFSSVFKTKSGLQPITKLKKKIGRRAFTKSILSETATTSNAIDHLNIDHLHTSDIISNIYTIDQMDCNTQEDSETSNNEIHLVYMESGDQETKFQMDVS